MTLTRAVTLSDDEQLEVLRRLDQFREWRSLDERRYCLVCGTIVSGRQIQIADGTPNGPVQLKCPTDGCNSIPMDWVLPTDEILAKVESMASEERKASALKQVAHPNGNGKTVHAVRERDDFMSRLRKFALHFKTHSLRVPS